jgi:hypothetical protein
MADTSARRPVHHELKTWPVYFGPIVRGEKRFEVRLDDRDFQTGDTVRLREYDTQGGYTGCALTLRIGYVLRGFLPEYVVFQLEPNDAPEEAKSFSFDDLQNLHPADAFKRVVDAATDAFQEPKEAING